MGKVLDLLKDKNTQYVIIIWILLIKVIEIAAGLLANIELLRFFELLGFSYLSAVSRMVWNAVVAFTIILLIYRLARDTFNISLRLKRPSKSGVISTVLLLSWAVSSIMAVLQFNLIASLPSASPQLEISRYYTPCGTVDNKLTTYFTINEMERGAGVTLDISKSVFLDPFSFCDAGEISTFGTKDGGLSYFTVKSSPIGQKVIEMRFFGNGTDSLDGWFANKITLEKPLQVNDSTTLILLLKLEQSSDKTAWTYIKLDFLSIDNGAYSLVWKFHDKAINSMLYSKDQTMKMYLLGSAVNWTFFQFNLHDVFYTSFSSHPQFLTSIEYGVGAEADNIATANFLLAKISNYPLKVNEEVVESVNPTVKMEDLSIRIQGINVLRLYVTLTLKPYSEKRNFQLSLTKISRLEQYEWRVNVSEGEFEKRIRFNITNNSTKIFLSGKEIALKAREMLSHEIEPLQGEVTLTFVNEVETYFTPIISIVLVPMFILSIWRNVKSKHKMKAKHIAFYF
jgi:hypothetical protein